MRNQTSIKNRIAKLEKMVVNETTSGAGGYEVIIASALWDTLPGETQSLLTNVLICYGDVIMEPYTIQEQNENNFIILTED